MFQRLCLTTLLVGLFFGSSSSVRADVTTVVNDGTLQITIGEPRDFSGEFFGQGEYFDGTDHISLQGELTEDIQIFDTFTLTLVTSIPREGIHVISIDVRGDAGVVFFQLEFDGDIDVEFQQSGFGGITSSIISGDVSVRAAQRVRTFAYSSAEVGGNLTFEGGPAPDRFGGSGLFVGGDLRIDTGPGPDDLTLLGCFVDGHTFIDLGGSTGGLSATPADDDRDSCEILGASFSGDLLIKGEQGDDNISIEIVDVGRDLFVDSGPGADFLEIRDLELAADSLIFLDGGTGNSDVLSLFGFAISPDEQAGFETVNQ